MKAIFSVVLFAVFATAVVLPWLRLLFTPSAHRPARWRPSPPQTAAEPRFAETTHCAPQPPQGGVTIAVEVPIVTSRWWPRRSTATF